MPVMQMCWPDRRISLPPAWRKNVPSRASRWQLMIR
jgi:hypothetical protein